MRKTPLFYVIENNNQITDLLISHGTDLLTQGYLGNTILHHAILQGCSKEIIGYLVTHDADLNAPNFEGMPHYIVY
ncbi:MAG: ankyrin repeat domain-containing protein [Rickettsiales endosymbiont of Dermacentor nuttalli]